jgi:hypothetical protein
MKIEQARQLAKFLNDAADAAEASGASEVSMINALQAADNVARDDLQAAIEAAQAASKA